MPAGDEEGICSAHHTRITRKGTACRDNFAFRSKSLARLPGGRGAQRAHAWCQPRAGRAYSARARRISPAPLSPAGQPPPVSPRRSALPHPAERARGPPRLRQGRERQVLAIAPGSPRAVLMVLAAAG